MENKKLVLVIRRDFSLWTNQMIRNIYVHNLPEIWGRGLIDQIVYYTGRTFEWYRYEDDFNLLGNYIVNKNIADQIFQEKIHAQFRNEVIRMRKYLSVVPNEISEPNLHLQAIKEAFISMYPIYTLSFFLPGIWREEFVSIHGKAGEDILKTLFKSREHSEGLLNLCDNFMRKWLGHILVKNSFQENYVKLLSIEEIENLVKNNILPESKTLEERAKGFVYMNGKIIPVSDFDKFLNERTLYREAPHDEIRRNEFKGMPACQGGVIVGKVKTIFNSDEVSDFYEGAILVAPMTSPTYLPAIKKAKAIITDEGGLTCHAAIIAREMKIPCVIGTKIATQVLRNDDLIEVDADNGIIRRLK